MNDSFGVVIPVRNAEPRLSPVVHRVLDVLSDLTPHFRLLIVDDASTDHTTELAHDLAKQFPQIDVVTHSRSAGLVESARRGLRHLGGDQVFIVPGRLPVDVASLRRAWRESSERGQVHQATACGWLGHRNRRQGAWEPRTHRGVPVSRGGIHQRWRQWGMAEQLEWNSRGRRIQATSARLERQFDEVNQRPDTVWEQRTAALLPLRRTRTRLAPPFSAVSPKAAGTTSEISSSDWHEERGETSELFISRMRPTPT